MPIHTIVDPQGNEYDIEGPAGSTKEQAIEYFKATYHPDKVKPTRLAKAVKTTPESLPSSTISDDLAIGAGNIAKLGITGAGLIAGAIPNYIADLTGSQEAREVGDKIFRGMGRVRKDIDELSGAGKVKQNFGGKVISAAPIIAAAAVSPTVGAMAMGSSAFDTAVTATDAGESQADAMKAVALDTAGNMVGTVAGPMGKAMPTRAITGAAVNAAQDYGTKLAIQSQLKTEGGKAAFNPTWEDAAVSGLVGAAMGAKQAKDSPFKKKAPVADPKATKLAELKASAESSAPYTKSAAESSADDATVARLEAAIAKQNPQRENPILVNSEGGAFVGDHAAIEGKRQAEIARAEFEAKFKEIYGDQFTSLQEALNPIYDKLEALKNQKIRDATQPELPFGPIDQDTSTYKAPQYGGGEGYGVVDENGMPIRADLSMEAQNLENPLQKNLWGDELGPALGQEKSLTEAVDTMLATGRQADGKFLGKETLPNALGREFDADPALRDMVDLANTGEVKVRDAQGNELGVEAVGTPPVAAFTTRRIPKSQQGGLDLAAITESIRDAAHWLSEPHTLKKVPSQDSADPIVRTMERSTNGDFIPNDEAPDTVIAKAKTESDSKAWNSLEAGGTLASYKRGQGSMTPNTLVEAGTRWFQNAGKRVNLSIRKYVTPVEVKFDRLPKKDFIEVANLLRQESFDRTEASLDQLQEAGYTPKQIEAVLELRQLNKTSLAEMNKIREMKGLKPVDALEAYISSRFSGPWRAPVKDKNGKTIWYIAEQSRRSAEKALAFLAENYPDIDVKGTKIEYTEGNRGHKDSISDAYSSIVDILGRNDPAVMEIKKIVEERAAANAYSALGQPKHFKNKMGVHGFLGDKPWLDDMTNAKQLIKSQMDYHKSAFKWSELNKAVDNVKQVLSDPDIVNKQPNNVKFVKDYMDNQLGRHSGEFSQGIQKIEQALAKQLGISVHDMRSRTGDFKSLWVTSKLFLNLGYTVANLVQFIQMTPTMHADISAQGYKHNPVKTAAMGLVDYFGHATGQGSEIGKKAWAYAQENGIYDRSTYEETHLLDHSPVMNAVENTVGQVIQAPDLFARMNAFLSYVHHLDQSGEYKGRELEMFQKAEELQNATMVDPRFTETAMAFRNFGTLGLAAQTLQNFKVNYYQQLNYYARQAALHDNMAPLAIFLAMQGIMSGVLGMPGVSDTDKVLELLKEYGSDDVYALLKDVSIKDWALRNLPDYASMGALSDLPVYKGSGVNIGSRFESGGIAENLTPESAIPFAKDVSNILGSLGNPTQALYNMAPPGAQGIMETTVDDFKAGGYTEDNRAYVNPRKLKDREHKITRTETEEDLRKWGMGLRATSEAKSSSLEYLNTRSDKLADDRVKGLSPKIYNAVRAKNSAEVARLAHRYVLWGGNPDSLNNIVLDAATKENVPKVVLQALQMSAEKAAVKAEKMRPLLKRYERATN